MYETIIFVISLLTIVKIIEKRKDIHLFLKILL